MFCQITDCVSQFTGMFCETCPFFDRTPENIKSVREAQEYQLKRDLEEIKKEHRARAYYKAETDKVCNKYCKQQKKNKEKKYLSAADEYAEYLRLKEKFEKEKK